MQRVCHLNGRVLPIEEARIDPRDRGLIFGDALYDAIKVLDSVILHLEPHLERLREGLEGISIPAPHDLEGRCRELVEAAGLDSGYLYLQVTRGVVDRTHMPPPDMEPTVLILPASHRFSPPAGRLMRAITQPDARWRHCDVKTTSLMATVLGKLEARDRGLDEVLFVGPTGELREGGSTNVFVRRGDAFETCPLDGSILPGVTRGILLRLAAAEGIDVVERAPRMVERAAWTEAFLCGTITGVQPLVELDGETIGDGAAGAWTGRLARALEAYERRLIEEAG